MLQDGQVSGRLLHVIQAIERVLSRMPLEALRLTAAAGYGQPRRKLAQPILDRAISQPEPPMKQGEKLHAHPHTLISLFIPKRDAQLDGPRPWGIPRKPLYPATSSCRSTWSTMATRVARIGASS